MTTVLCKTVARAVLKNVTAFLVVGYIRNDTRTAAIHIVPILVQCRSAKRIIFISRALMSEAGLQINLHMMASFIHLYYARFSPAAILHDESESKHIVNFWHFKANDMDRFFDEKP